MFPLSGFAFPVSTVLHFYTQLTLAGTGVCADTQRAHTDRASFVKCFRTFCFTKWKQLKVIIENDGKYWQPFLYILQYIKRYFEIKNRFSEDGESGVL
jgi:hypothetical protein